MILRGIGRRGLDSTEVNSCVTTESYILKLQSWCLSMSVGLCVGDRLAHSILDAIAISVTLLTTVPRQCSADHLRRRDLGNRHRRARSLKQHSKKTKNLNATESISKRNRK